MDLHFSLQASYFHVLQSPRGTWPWRGRSMKWRLGLPRELIWVTATDPSGLHWVSILHPTGVQWLTPVPGQAVFWGETSSDTRALCGMSAKPGPMEGRSTQGTELIYQYLCILKALPAVPGLGIPELLPATLKELPSEMLGQRAARTGSPAAGSRGSSSCCTSRAGWPGSPRGPRCPRCAWWTPGRARTAGGQSSRSPPLQSTPSAPSGFLSRICWRSPCQVWLIKQNK